MAEVPCLTLSLVYLLVLGVVLVKTYKIYGRAWVQIQLFYAFITFQVLFRMIAFGILEEKGNLTDKKRYLLVYLPDSMFLISFLLLFWQILALKRHSHMYLGNAKTIGPYLQSISTYICPVITIGILSETLCYALFLCSIISTEIKSMELACINLILPIAFLGSQLAMQISYSGIPFKSVLHTKRHYIAGTTGFIWAICRVTRGIVGILWPKSIENESVLFVVVLILTEIGCYLVVLDDGQIELFLIHPEDKENENELLQSEDDDFNAFESSHRLVFDPSEVECTHEMPSRHHGLGRVYLAKFRDQMVLYRRVNFKRMSSFMQEEIMEDLKLIKEVTSEHVVQFFGCTLSNHTLGLISTYYHQGSLYSLLHEAKEELEFITKLNIARDLAMGMRDLHYQSQYHGHLTSHNVLLEGDKVVMIADFGLERMKKLAGLMCGYCNKSGWSSPELLMAEGPVAWQVQESDDVYSFGVVLWEILTSQVPFPDLPPEDLRHVVAEQYNRPELTPDINEVLAKLIKSCWNISPGKRPSFKLIYSTLCLIPT